VRCHGADWNIVLAREIRRVLGIRYAVSLHINPDVNPPRCWPGPDLTPAQREHNDFYERIQRDGLRAADCVLPVYQPILPFLERIGVTRREVCYNVLDGARLRPKQSWALSSPARILSVGRLFDDKDPSAIVRALHQLPGAELTVVGDGPKRPQLEALVKREGLAERVHFRPAVRNAELCEMLADFDIFAVHTEYWEINKSTLEALLVGLPVVINRRRGEPVPELQGDHVLLVDNTPQAYAEALGRLLRDHAFREALGRRALDHARERYAPERTEAHVVEVYRRLLALGRA
jgi:glycosyltransferase involved in cell wall biosynthesis